MKEVAVAFAFVCVLATLTAPRIAQCSSFFLDADGTVVVGATFDHCEYHDGLVIVNKRGVLKRGFSHGATGECASWISKYGSVTFSATGRELPLYGMNEAGLVVTTVDLAESECSGKDERPPLEGGLWVQYLLDNFGTVEEVVQSDSTARMVGDGSHYLVCDKDGGFVIVECGEGMVNYYLGEAAPVAALSNAPYADCVTHWERGVIPDPDPDASVERFLAASQWIDDYEAGRKPAVEYAFDILDHTSKRECVQWRIVFDANDLRFYFRTKKVKAIRNCRLDDLDFDCSKASQMLDMAEKLRGDVSADFYDYSLEVGVACAERAVSTSAVDKSLQEMKELLEFFESYKCTGPDD